MPFKHNTSRRHHIPKARRRITNWPAYESGLRRRGDVTFWLDEAALSGWCAPRRTSRGGQSIYAGLAIEIVLTLRLLFHLALRQVESFTRSIMRLLGLEIAVPDHSTLSRRGRGFAGRQSRALRHDRPIHIVLDTPACRSLARASGCREAWPQAEAVAQAASGCRRRNERDRGARPDRQRWWRHQTGFGFAGDS
jgi:hypothetical protein